MHSEIPSVRPDTPLLDQLEQGHDLHSLQQEQLVELAAELRAFLLYSAGQTGGHFGAGLGVVELTVALHHVYNTPDDRIVWDVGHQAYPHKILTGRRERMHTVRKKNGVAPFPKRDERPPISDARSRRPAGREDLSGLQVSGSGRGNPMAHRCGQGDHPFGL